jgi:hypothetical protein
VYDQDTGEWIAGACVVVGRDSSYYETTTDQNGWYSVSDIPAGCDYYVHVAAVNCYEQLIEPVGVSPGLSTDVSVAMSCIQAVLRPIDVKPGSDPNSINQSDKGRIAVAVLAHSMYSDLNEIDLSTVTLMALGMYTESEIVPIATRRKGTCMAGWEDVNGDELCDLVLHFSVPALCLSPDHVLAVLQGQTHEGMPIEGRDLIRVVPADH